MNKSDERFVRDMLRTIINDAELTKKGKHKITLRIPGDVFAQLTGICERLEGAKAERSHPTNEDNFRGDRENEFTRNS